MGGSPPKPPSKGAPSNKFGISLKGVVCSAPVRASRDSEPQPRLVAADKRLEEYRKRSADHHTGCSLSLQLVRWWLLFHCSQVKIVASKDGLSHIQPSFALAAATAGKGIGSRLCTQILTLLWK